MKLKMKYKRYIFPIFMGASMSIIMSLLNIGRVVFPGILLMMLLQAVIASIASYLFPAGLVSLKLIKRVRPDISYLPLLFMSSILPAVYFTMILSMTGLLRMRGYSGDFIVIYLHSLPKNIILGYITSVFWNMILDTILIKEEA